MSLKHFVSCMACLMLSLGGAATAQAKTYALAGGGGQLAIGGNLPRPVGVFPTGVTGTVFPPLGIPAKTGVTLQGTTARSKHQRITLPAGALSRPAQQGTVGVFTRNPFLYAVATNLGFVWPAAPAVFSTAGRPGPTTISYITSLFGSGLIRYSNPLASKFGGPAQFAISYGPAGGRIPAAPVTLYAIALPPAGNPPCVHTSLTTGMGGPFPGPGNPACIAGLGASAPASLGALGASAYFFVSAPTPLPTPVPGVGFGKFGASPLGTVSSFVYTPSGNPGFTDIASSWGFPWTTGMITISQPVAAVPQIYTITGMDNRTSRGSGTIQMVAGSLSQRAVSGPGADRGWVRLQLVRVPPHLPTMSPAGLAAAAGLMLLAVAYALRRRRSA